MKKLKPTFSLNLMQTCALEYISAELIILRLKFKKFLKKLSKLISSTKYKCSAFSFSSVGLTTQNTSNILALVWFF